MAEREKKKKLSSGGMLGCVQTEEAISLSQTRLLALDKVSDWFILLSE